MRCEVVERFLGVRALTVAVGEDPGLTLVVRSFARAAQGAQVEERRFLAVATGPLPFQRFEGRPEALHLNVAGRHPHVDAIALRAAGGMTSAFVGRAGVVPPTRLEEGVGPLQFHRDVWFVLAPGVQPGQRVFGLARLGESGYSKYTRRYAATAFG